MAVTATSPPVEPRLVTADEYSELARTLGRSELVRGRVITMAPAHDHHGFSCSHLHIMVGHWILSHGLGMTATAETGFWVERDPDSVRAPDFAFIRTERLTEPLPDGWCRYVPDLVIEAYSPGTPKAEMLGKAGMWLDVGVSVVWVLQVGERCLVEYRSDGRVRRLTAGDAITCEDLLPGFSYPLAQVFAGLAST